MAKGERWTLEEIEYIKANYGTMPIGDIAAKLGRGEPGLRRVVTHYNITNRRSWTISEEDYVIEHYPEMSIQEISQQIGRSYQAVRNRLRYLGVEVKKHATPEEDAPLLILEKDPCEKCDNVRCKEILIRGCSLWEAHFRYRWRRDVAMLRGEPK